MLIKTTNDAFHEYRGGHDTVPSPGKYDTMSASMKTLPRAPGFKMTTTRTGRSKQELVQRAAKSPIPGPSEYSPDPFMRTCPKYSFASSNGKSAMAKVIEKARNEPGVGEYNIANFSAQKNAPKCVFNMAKKDELRLINTPGPSCYKPIFVLKKASNPTIGNSTRDINLKSMKRHNEILQRGGLSNRENYTPGPADYNLTKHMTQAP